MKMRLSILLMILSVTIFSLTKKKSNLPNADSWSISIGQKNLLASWLNNEMGDTVTLTRIKLNGSDSLVASRYLCGQTAEGSITLLSVKTSDGELIAEGVNNNKYLHFTAKMRMSTIMYSPKIKSGDVVGVFFTIKHESDQGEDYTILLGHLKLE